MLEEGERRGPVRPDWRHPAWNPRIFEAVFGSPFEPVGTLTGFPLRSSDLLYSTLWGQRAVRYAGYERGRGAAAGPSAERFLQEALRVAPYLHEAEDLLADLYRARGSHERAAEHRQRARDLRRALSGQGPLDAEVRPARVPLQGG